jgi:chromosome segregation ATPase
MKQRSTETPEAALKFAPAELAPQSFASPQAFASMEKLGGDMDPTDQSGRAVVALLQQAAAVSNENCDRAMSMAHKLSVQLRTAEDQIAQLRAELEHFQGRATRAEEWLQVIRKEIEERLLVPRLPAQPNQLLQ